MILEKLMISSQNYLVTKRLLNLSEQQLVSCSDSNHGCEGGLPTNAMKELIKKKEGMEMQREYRFAMRIDQIQMNLHCHCVCLFSQ